MTALLVIQSAAARSKGSVPGLFERFLETASKISTAWSLAAFAIVALLTLLILQRRPQNARNPTVWAGLLGITILALTPIVADAFLRHDVLTADIYRLRVMVVGPDSVPVDHAKVWSSWGGQPKEFDGGWQFDIPRSTIPKNGELTVFASREQNFLKGRSTLALGADMNPAVILVLRDDSSAVVTGTVLDEQQHPIAGAKVWVDSFSNESVTANGEGEFRLQAHASAGKQVLIHASRRSYAPTAQYHPAGGEPAVLVLGRAR